MCPPPPSSQHSTVETNNSTMNSADDRRKSLVEVAIPELPKILREISFNRSLDDDSLTEILGMYNNENLDDSVVTNHINTSTMHQDTNNL